MAGNHHRYSFGDNLFFKMPIEHRHIQPFLITDGMQIDLSGRAVFMP